MTTYRTSCLAAALAILGTAAACQQSPQAPAASTATTSSTSSSSTTTTPATPADAGTPTAATTTLVAPTTPLAPTKADPCALLSAAEVGAIMGKTVVKAPGGGCTYGLDTTQQQAELAQTQKEMQSAQRAGASGDMAAMMRGMGQMGSKHPKLGASMMQQLEVSLDAVRDDQTEEGIKAIYANTGATVRGATAPLQPEQRGLTGLIQGIDDVSGVGDWAFATNVASVNMGGMMSIRGRILEARKGPWHVTVSTTVAPDPGVPKLDRQLGDVARALLAKL